MIVVVIKSVLESPALALGTLLPFRLPSDNWCGGEREEKTVFAHVTVLWPPPAVH